MHQSGHSRAHSMQTVQVSSSRAMTPRLRGIDLSRVHSQPSWVANGACEPPRNSTVVKEQSSTSPEDSDSRERANRRRVYSVKAPKMIPETATGMSKGDRGSSASQATKN